MLVSGFTVGMKSKQSQQVADLESQLVRLNTLVRQRRAQLERLKTCPNKGCECRKVWREVIEKDLAGQVGKIRKRITPAAKAAKRA